MDSEDDSPQSISDEDDANELLEIKPPQAKIFKHSHHRSEKHSNRHLYVSSKSRHHKSHHSHRHTDDRRIKERFAAKVKSSSSNNSSGGGSGGGGSRQHHKEYEPDRNVSRRHLPTKDRYEEKITNVKSSRGHHKEYENEKQSRRHGGSGGGGGSSSADDRLLLRERHETAANSKSSGGGGRSVQHAAAQREYEPPEPQQLKEYEEYKRKKASSSSSSSLHHSHHSRREEKKQNEKRAARILDDENFRFEVVDDEENSSDVEMKASEPERVNAVEGGAGASTESSSSSNSSSSNNSSGSTSSSSQESNSSNTSSEEDGEMGYDDDDVVEAVKAVKVEVKKETASENSDDIDANDANDDDDDEEEDEDEDDDDDEDEEMIGETNDGSKDETPPRIVATNEDVDNEIELEKDTLPAYFPAIQGCRSVEEFQCLNRIEEGTYGVVYRAREKRTDKIVALKRLKMEKEKEGFPITSLREINTLLKAQHPNVVTVKEIVVGSSMDKIFIVMDYVEHDLKSLMETMKQKKTAFTADEIKCLMTQLLQAVGHLHDNWILHRDLKTSNLLFSHSGVLKVGDFGLAREYGSPLKNYTPVVVTLWYRAPELLLGTKEYSTSVDMWSVGCIFAEFLRMEPLFPGKTEIDQLNRIFKALGTPTEADWPEYPKFPVVQKVPFPRHPPHGIRSEFKYLSDKGYDLLKQFLTYDTKKRISAENAVLHDYFSEQPVAIDPAMFPTWPAKSDPSYRKAIASSPKPPSGGQDYKELGEDDGFFIGVGERNSRNYNPLQTSFKLKF